MYNMITLTEMIREVGHYVRRACCIRVVDRFCCVNRGRRSKNLSVGRSDTKLFSGHIKSSHLYVFIGNF